MLEKYNSIVDAIKSNTTAVVSFDIFDTLLMRVGEPSLILKLCADINDVPYDVFTRYRKWDNKWWCEVSDSEESLSGTKELRNKLKQSEMDLEKQTLRARPIVKSLYDAAIASKKEVIITTDMYLPVDFLKELLIVNGYSGFKKIYRSGHGKSKKNKELFKDIIDEYNKRNISASSILHIGDNELNDYENPNSLGINAIRIPSTLELMKSSMVYSSFKPVSLGDNLLIGYLANQLYKDTFDGCSGYLNGMLKNIGLMLGPFFMSFAMWLARELVSNNRDQILLIKRDGDIIRQIFDAISKYVPLVDYEEIFFSRSLRGSTIIENDGITGENIKKKSDLISDCYFLNNSLDRAHQLLEKNENIKLSSEEMIELSSLLDHDYLQQSSQALKGYLLSKIGNHKSPSLFDVGYSGSAMSFIKRYFADLSQYNISEYQIIGKPFSDGSVHNFIEQDKARRYLHLDKCVKSCEKASKTLTCIGNGKYSVEYDGLENVSLGSEYLKKLIIGYCKGFVDLFEESINKMSFGKNTFWDSIKEIYQNGTSSDQELLKMYDTGTLSQFDYPIAESIFEDSYNHGDIYSSVYLSVINRVKKNKDLVKSERYAKKAVDAGIDYARIVLFDVLWDKKNHSDDCKLLHIIEPIVNCSAEASGRIARMYRDGRGVIKDLNKAAEQMYIAVDKGINWAKYEYLDILWAMNTDESDLLYVAYSFELSSKNSFPAMARLARAYWFGRGITLNQSESIRLMRVATDGGVKWAKYELFDMLWKMNTIESYKEAYEMIKPYADLGDLKSIALVARAYRDGKGVEQDISIAKIMMKQAADGGISWAKTEYQSML